MGTLKATIEVYVYDPVALVLTPSAVHVPLGGTATIRASFNPPLDVAETAAITKLGFGDVTVQDRLTVDPGQTTSFTIKGVKRGHVTLSATLGPVRGNAVTLVDIEVGGSRIVVKAAPTARFEIGEEIRAAVDLDRVHLFDAASETAIARR